MKFPKKNCLGGSTAEFVGTTAKHMSRAGSAAAEGTGTGLPADVECQGPGLAVVPVGKHR